MNNKNLCKQYFHEENMKWLHASDPTKNVTFANDNVTFEALPEAGPESHALITWDNLDYGARTSLPYMNWSDCSEKGCTTFTLDFCLPFYAEALKSVSVSGNEEYFL